MSLIDAGNYNVHFNEFYYILQLIVLSIFLFLVIILGYIAYRRLRSSQQVYEIDDLAKKIDDNLKDLMKKFAAYAHNLDAINLVMGVEDKVRSRYYKEMIPLMKRLIPHEDWIYLHCQAIDIQCWEKYKKELRKGLPT